MPKPIKPKIALVITDQESNAAIKKAKPDLLELRADLFKTVTPEYIARQIKQRRLLKIPLLLTVRNQQKEGARKEIPTQLKREILETCLPLVDVLDIELSSPLLKEAVSLGRKLKKKIIVSAHNFDHTPAHLDHILKKALSTRADIVKIAALAKSMDDVYRMIDFTHRYAKHGLITMSLGDLGKVSRLVLPMIGSQYTYSFIGKATAPGQIDMPTLLAHLKYYYNAI